MAAAWLAQDSLGAPGSGRKRRDGPGSRHESLRTCASEHLSKINNEAVINRGQQEVCLGNAWLPNMKDVQASTWHGG